MIIDSHTHIGKRHIVASAEDLVKSMDVAKIDKSLVFAGKINDQATEVLLQDIAPFKDRLYGIGSVSPFNGPDRHRGKEYFILPPDNKISYYIEELLATNQIFGLKFYTGYEHYFPNEQALESIYRLLIKYNKPAIFHTGDCYNGVCGAKLKYAHPLHIDDLAVDYPELKIIIAHMGYPWVRDAAEVCYKNANVYADTSGFVYGKFTLKDFYNYKDVIEEFIKIAGGTQKLIFGTDWPISDQKSYVKTFKGRPWWAGLFDFIYVSSAEQKQIMGLRAAKLFGIE